MNDDLEDRLRSMLAARARSAPLEPDHERVVSEGSEGSARAAVERVAFFAAVAAILAIVVSAALVFGGGTDEGAISGPASGVGQDPALGGGSADSAELTSSTFDTSTTTTEAGPTTTVLGSDCVVRTTEGAGGSMVEVVDCPTTLTGPGATLDCSAERDGDSTTATTACGEGAVSYTCDPATWPEGVTSNTDPSCSPTTDEPAPVSSIPLCDITTIPGDDCFPLETTAPSETTPTAPQVTADSCAVTTIEGCVPVTPTPTTGYVGSSSAPTTPPPTGS